MTLLDKLQKIQLELKVHKGQRNSFGNYNYRSAEDILEAIKPIQEKYKVTFTISDNLMFFGDKGIYLNHVESGVDKYQNKVFDRQIESQPIAYIVSEAKITDNESLDSLSAFAQAIIDFEAKGMQNPQRTGSASSYAKKYALGNLLLIDDTRDSDATNTHNKTSTKKSIKIGTPEFQKAKQALSLGKITIEQLKAKYNVSDVVVEQLNKQ